MNDTSFSFSKEASDPLAPTDREKASEFRKARDEFYKRSMRPEAVEAQKTALRAGGKPAAGQEPAAPTTEPQPLIVTPPPPPPGGRTLYDLLMSNSTDKAAAATDDEKKPEEPAKIEVPPPGQAPAQPGATAPVPAETAAPVPPKPTGPTDAQRARLDANRKAIDSAMATRYQSQGRGLWLDRATNRTVSDAVRNQSLIDMQKRIAGDVEGRGGQDFDADAFAAKLQRSWDARQGQKLNVRLPYNLGPLSRDKHDPMEVARANFGALSQSLMPYDAPVPADRQAQEQAVARRRAVREANQGLFDQVRQDITAARMAYGRDQYGRTTMPKEMQQELASMERKLNAFSGTSTGEAPDFTEYWKPATGQPPKATPPVQPPPGTLPGAIDDPSKAPPEARLAARAHAVEQAKEDVVPLWKRIWQRGTAPVAEMYNRGKRLGTGQSFSEGTVGRDLGRMAVEGVTAPTRMAFAQTSGLGTWLTEEAHRAMPTGNQQLAGASTAIKSASDTAQRILDQFQVNIRMGNLDRASQQLSEAAPYIQAMQARVAEMQKQVAGLQGRVGYDEYQAALATYTAQVQQMNQLYAKYRSMLEAAQAKKQGPAYTFAQSGQK